MTTAPEAFAALRARLEANFTACPLVWPNENTVLPADPAAFAYVEIMVDSADIAAFGGGLGANIYRNTGRMEAHVLAPQGSGLAAATALAEQIAAVFRSYRAATLSCSAAWVEPGGRDAANGTYYRSTAVAEFTFDQVG